MNQINYQKFSTGSAWQARGAQGKWIYQPRSLLLWYGRTLKVPKQVVWPNVRILVSSLLPLFLIVEPTEVQKFAQGPYKWIMHWSLEQSSNYLSNNHSLLWHYSACRKDKTAKNEANPHKVGSFYQLVPYPETWMSLRLCPALQSENPKGQVLFSVYCLYDL